MDDSELIAKIIDAGKILQNEGLKDLTRGHVSARLPHDPSRFYMKPHSVGFGEITPQNIVTCTLEGEKIDGGGRMHSEVYIHSEIFKLRQDIGSVIHAHPPYAVALAATGQEIEPISQPSSLFVDRLPVFDATMDLIRTPAQGHQLALALGGHMAVLMRGHGVVVAGETLEEAVVRMLMLENACMIQLLAKTAGPTMPSTFPEDVAALREKLSLPEQFAINFEYLRRLHR